MLKKIWANLKRSNYMMGITRLCEEHAGAIAGSWHPRYVHCSSGSKLAIFGFSPCVESMSSWNGSSFRGWHDQNNMFLSNWSWIFARMMVFEGGQFVRDADEMQDEIRLWEERWSSISRKRLVNMEANKKAHVRALVFFLLLLVIQHIIWCGCAVNNWCLCGFNGKLRCL
jgi:hypothetical protein